MYKQESSWAVEGWHCLAGEGKRSTTRYTFRYWWVWVWVWGWVWFPAIGSLPGWSFRRGILAFRYGEGDTRRSRACEIAIEKDVQYRSAIAWKIAWLSW